MTSPPSGPVRAKSYCELSAACAASCKPATSSSTSCWVKRRPQSCDNICVRCSASRKTIYSRAMTARTHDLAAITALGLVALVFPVHDLTLSTALVAILANQIGGIVPDIDQPTAPLWRNLPIGRVFGKAFDM